MATVYSSKARNSLAAEFIIEENRRKNMKRVETPRREGHN